MSPEVALNHVKRQVVGELPCVRGRWVFVPSDSESVGTAVVRDDFSITCSWAGSGAWFVCVALSCEGVLSKGRLVFLRGSGYRGRGAGTEVIGVGSVIPKALCRGL